ncbi:NXPE1-like protein [Mya arenaria]|uniref:NXPE1-like protein n=1 Tax=Mya arenaria TaxID=6604 RepID=A0ABY7F524_MYAAR|nr:NXPE1-like protein [Mya arenaria]
MDSHDGGVIPSICSMTEEDTLSDVNTNEDDFLPFPHLLTEEDTISDEPTNELTHVSSAEKSTFTIIVQIELYDHAGNRKSSGGELVKVTLTRSDLTNTAVTGYVLDNGNGSYTAEIEALWAGKSNLSASLVYSRQAIAALYRIRREILSTRVIQATFSSRTYQETTDCHPNISHLLKLKNYSAFCNFTYINSGMPWYCGRPRDIHLLCEDWHAVKTQAFPPLPITKVEDTIISRGVVPISKAIALQVAGNRQMEAKNPCSRRNFRELWRERQSTGYFFNGIWHLRQCAGINRTQIPGCIQNKTMYLLGDSTLRQWYLNYVLKNLECQPTSEDWTKVKWLKPATCRNKQLNFSASWFIPSQPIFADDDENSYTLYSIARHIDDIPDNEETFVVIHLFMHMVPYHHGVFQKRMAIIKRSVEKLLNRNPKAKVFLKAPHTFLDTPWGGARLDDFFGFLYTNILYQTFRGLHDKVVFLNNRDSSDALQLKPNHPPPYVVLAMVDQMFSYACT